MKTVSWNCRGLGSPLKIKAVQDLLKMEAFDLLLMQETKIEEKLILKIGKEKWKKDAGIAVSARGASGGLATLWAEKDFEILNSFAT